VLIVNTLIKPSSLLPKGLRIQKIEQLTLFKFTDDLGDQIDLKLVSRKMVVEVA
jgi:hypothetical protein